MNKLLILVNGQAGAGKDTFVNECIWQGTLLDNDKKGIGLYTLSYADPAKKALCKLGWEPWIENKTPSVRHLLADLVDFGDETGANFAYLQENVDQVITPSIIFCHMRNPKTIQKVKEFYNDPAKKVKCESVLILRDDLSMQEPDRWGIYSYTYDTVVNNNGTLDQLEEKAKDFIAKRMKLFEV